MSQSKTENTARSQKSEPPRLWSTATPPFPGRGALGLPLRQNNRELARNHPPNGRDRHLNRTTRRLSACRESVRLRVGPSKKDFCAYPPPATLSHPTSRTPLPNPHPPRLPRRIVSVYFFRMAGSYLGLRIFGHPIAKSYTVGRDPALRGMPRVPLLRAGFCKSYRLPQQNHTRSFSLAVNS